MTEERLNEIGNEILAKAENLFGIRQAFPFYGFRFRKGVPQLIFENGGYVIYIGDLAKNSTDESEANFQIAHEVIHLITPTTIDNVTVLEEGLAIAFSIQHLRDIGESEKANANIDHLKTKYPVYFSAFENVNRIENVFNVFNELRETFPDIRLSDLASENLNGLIKDDELALELCNKFNCR